MKNEETTFGDRRESQWLREPSGEPSLLELSRGEASHRRSQGRVKNGCAKQVVRCEVGVGLLLLKAKSEGTAKVQRRDIEAIASKLKD